MLRRLAKTYSRRARAKRAQLFVEALAPTSADRILDLGSEDGSHIAAIVPFRENVYIADISPEHLEAGQRKYGFRTVLLAEEGPLPFEDGFFDIVFCSSVIEHVSGRKEEAARFETQRAFAATAFAAQRAFADEVRRIAKHYFVQTPNKYFPIESHTWLPAIIVFLPRRAQVRAIEFFNRWWPKKTYPDWHLLTEAQMHELFPDAEIVLEKSLGLTKSLIAVGPREAVARRVGGAST